MAFSFSHRAVRSSSGRNNAGKAGGAGDGQRSSPPRTASCLLILSVSLVAVAPSAAAQDFEDLTSRAAAARDADRPEDAIALYTQALRVNPNWPEGWWNLGVLNYHADRYGEGRDAFRRLVTVDPMAGAAWAFLGLCQFNTGELDDSLASLSRAATLGISGSLELLTSARLHLALLLSRFERFDESFLLLFDLAYQQPESRAVVDALGIAALRLPYLPKEVPADQIGMVRLAGQAMAALADFRLDKARKTYRILLQQYPGRPEVLRANPDQLISGGPEGGFEVQFAQDFAGPSEARLGEDDLVLGVVLKGEARAYPVNYMNGPINEVVNDEIRGQQIAATW